MFSLLDGAGKKLPLKPFSDDNAVMYGMGATIRAEKRGGEEHLTFSGFDFAKGRK